MMMKYVLLALVAILPAAFYVFYIVAFDNKRPEPPKALLLSVILGGLAALAVVCLGAPYQLGIAEVLPAHDWGESLGMGVLRLALPAEIAKWIMLCVFLSLNKYYDEYIDGIVYSVCLGMGFGGVWGALFLFEILSSPLEFFVGTCVISALVLIPLHYLTASLMGYFVALARRNHKVRNHVLALLIPLGVDALICSIVIMTGAEWGYIILGIVLAILAAIVYTQICRLLEMDGVDVRND